MTTASQRGLPQPGSTHGASRPDGPQPSCSRPRDLWLLGSGLSAKQYLQSTRVGLFAFSGLQEAKGGRYGRSMVRRSQPAEVLLPEW